MGETCEKGILIFEKRYFWKDTKIIKKKQTERRLNDPWNKDWGETVNTKS